jgi:hypothetical protein
VNFRWPWRTGFEKGKNEDCLGAGSSWQDGR